MAAHARSWFSSLGRWLSTHPFSAVGIVVLSIVSIPFVTRSDSEWEYVYVRAAQELRSGHDIYQPEIANSYPPFATLTALPFTEMSPLAQRLLWLTINLVCLLFLLRTAWALAGGGQLEGPTRAPWREQLAAILGGLCGVFYLQNALAHHQTDIVLGALLFGGCLALNRERPLLAATCFGLAAAVKCTPLLWAPYLIWRRRPVAAVWLIAVAIGVNLLPDLVQRPASGHLWLTEYATRYLLPMGQADHYAGTWYSALVYNQSLAGAGQRWFATTCQWAADDCIVLDRPDRLAPHTLNSIIYCLDALLLLLTLAICWRPFRANTTEAVSSIPRNALEYGVVFQLMLLLSPMSSKAHFGVLLLPGFCLARAACAGRRWLWPLLAAAICLALTSNKSILGERLYTLSLWLGGVTWETLILLMGTFALLSTGDQTVSLRRLNSATGETQRRAA